MVTEVPEPELTAAEELALTVRELTGLSDLLAKATAARDEPELGRLLVRQRMLESTVDEVRARAEAESASAHEAEMTVLRQRHLDAMAHRNEVVGKAQAMVREALQAEQDALSAVTAADYERNRSLEVPKVVTPTPDEQVEIVHVQPPYPGKGT